MKKLLFLLLIACISNQIVAQVVINELECDTPSFDEKEFIELKTDTPNASLDGYVLVLFNGSFDESYFALDLDGATSDENGLLLIGSSFMMPFPQLLVPFNLIQNGADAIAIYEADASDFPEGTPPTTTNLIDALVYDTNDADDAGLLAALGETVQINEGVSNALTSIQLLDNGTYVAAVATPRQLNEGGGVVFNPCLLYTSPSPRD